MRKTLATLFAIGLIGLLGVADKTRLAAPHLVPAASTSAATAASSGQPSNLPTNTVAASYKDGSYTGQSEFTPYGIVQIAVVVNGGRITNVNFLQMPSDQRESQVRTDYSEPLLKQETIAKQSPSIDFVSGATSTSEGYQQSLQAALNQARSA